MHLEDFLTAFDIRQADIHLAVKPAGAQQRFVQDIGAVGGRHDNNAVVRVETVHLDKQLVQRLFTLVMPAAKAGAALATDRVDLINEDDAGHRLFGLFKQITHAGCADADIHFNKIGARDRVKRHAGFAGAGAGEQRFAGTRRAYQQHAVRDARAEGVEFAGCFEEFDNLLQFGFFFIGAGHISEGSLALAFLLVLDLGAPDVHQAAAPCPAAVHRHEEQHHAADHKGIEQDLKPGDRIPQANHVILHRGVGVGLVVGINIPLDIFKEISRIGQAVCDRNDPAVLGAVVLTVGQL